MIGAMVGVGVAAACSGAMYAGVPSATPSEVNADGAQRGDALSAFATPKSVTIAGAAREQHVVGLDVAMHDAASCAYASASATSLRMRMASLTGSVAVAREPRAQRFAFDERHGVVRQAVRLDPP